MESSEIAEVEENEVVAEEGPTTPAPPKILSQACFLLPVWFEGYVTL